MDVNILLMGKTGVGKSSFINYLLGTELAETGIGKPVTQKTTQYSKVINGNSVKVYDTKGFEANDSEKMKGELIDDISEHNGDNDFQRRYHTIFYCVSMSNPRLDDFEIEFIKRIENKISQPINFILTNCDSAKSGQIEEMKVRIHTSFNKMNFSYNISEVCSVSIKKRLGRTEQYGREKIIENLFDQVLDDSCTVMAKKSTQIYLDKTKQLFDEIKQYAQSAYKRNLNHNKNLRLIQSIINQIPPPESWRKYDKEIKDEIGKLSEKYKDFIISYYKVFKKEDIDKEFNKIVYLQNREIITHFNLDKLGLSHMLADRLQSPIYTIKFMVLNKKSVIKFFDEELDKVYRAIISEEKICRDLEKDFKKINEKAKNIL